MQIPIVAIIARQSLKVNSQTGRRPPVGALHAALFPGRGIFILSAYSVVKVQLQLRKSSRYPPSWMGVYFERLLCYNGDNRNLYFLLSPP